MGNDKVNLICEQLEFAREETVRVANAVPETARLFQPGEGRPTAMWLLGHLGNTMNSVVMRWCLRADNVFPKEYAKIFAPDFAGGEPPSTDASKYPAYDEVVKMYEHAMTKAVEALRALNDEDLDKPLQANVPDAIRTFFPTIGKSLQRMISHDGYHRGQMAMLAKIAK